MNSDSKLVQIIVEAILHLKDCAGGRNCTECVKSATIIGGALADAVQASRAMETAAGSIMAGIHTPRSPQAPISPMQ